MLELRLNITDSKRLHSFETIVMLKTKSVSDCLII
jgi:hypothetical protein